MQLNITYFSAVEEDEMWYLLARALQFFTPGVPLVYYVGLLAGANDAALVEETGTGRDINRHPYTVPEAEKEMKRPVVKVRPARPPAVCALVAARFDSRVRDAGPGPWGCQFNLLGANRSCTPRRYDTIVV